MSNIPEAILEKLKEQDSVSTFSGSLPRVTASSGSTYFVKIGSPAEAAQYSGEALSLKLMNAAAPGIAPRVISSGTLEISKPYFISEYKDIGSLSSKAAQTLAKRMATELHSEEHASLEGFGFSIPTYCGVTKLSNGWFDTWDKCYASMVGDLLSQLESKGRYQHLCQKGRRVQAEVIPKLLGPLVIKPVILHGDLWSGNAGVDRKTGEPVIFDPASYYGHNEADLSIAKIFGGFPSEFYDTYHQYRPKSEPVHQYDLRMDLYELFHYLNHTLIFRGHYAGSAEKKMDNLLRAEL
ncbi:Protein-ribulosamine 3-kinase, chloroplastic [Psilocybe cubensis]|uniref:protein-ribulosamine 3-kinase n=2 Tax=Psilocybe cubensis TaxID=181762 RepID=A0A8H7XMD3_PSICU|nr:Protein-ribulosamine 3-kinase, chloroplastic [Psilocybe cubensis]KAH9483297.1 Protein-ribulosamine 3-kinase, chloroplastic [Psilocybe cubensis]